jgi:hypothetical protein
MTALPTIAPCACGNDEPDMRFGESSSGPAVVVHCLDCGTQGWADESAFGAISNWNAGERGKRADW